MMRYFNIMWNWTIENDHKIKLFEPNLLLNFDLLELDIIFNFIKVYQKYIYWYILKWMFTLSNQS